MKRQIKKPLLILVSVGIEGQMVQPVVVGLTIQERKRDGIKNQK